MSVPPAGSEAGLVVGSERPQEMDDLLLFLLAEALERVHDLLRVPAILNDRNGASLIWLQAGP